MQFKYNDFKEILATFKWVKEIKSLSTMELGSKYQKENESCYKGKFKVSRTDGM